MNPANVIASLARALALLLVLSGILRADRYAVFRSADHGKTWERTGQGLPDASRVNALGATGETLVAGTDSGLFISRDHGRSWAPPRETGSTQGRVLSIAARGTTAFAGTDGAGIRISTDAGITWSAAPGLRTSKVRSLLVHGDTIYAGTDADGVHASTDLGRTWRHLAAGFPTSAQAFALGWMGDRLFAGLYAYGLVAWDEASGRWTRLPQVRPLALGVDGPNLVAGHNPGGLFWSADKGITWTRGKSGDGPEFGTPFTGGGEALPPEAPVWEMGSSDGLVLAGAAAGVYRSTDGGRTWNRCTIGLPPESPGIAFHVGPGIALVAVRSGP